MKSVKPGDKAKYIIAIILVIAAVLMIVAAVTLDWVSPPDITGDDPSDGIVSAISSDRRENFFTVLVVGIDAASNSTDTIMLAAFDIENKKMNIMSIPRDTITNTTRKVKKINASYISHHKDITALMDEVEGVTGVYPDKYALVTVDSFSEIIDEIGGVEFDVPFNMIYNDPTQDLKINIKKGYQTLYGHDAMGLMRYRATYAEGDIGRIKMQQAFVGAVMDKMIKPSTIPKIPEIAQIIFDNIETNLTLGNEVWIGKELVTLNREEDIFMTTLPGVAGSYDGLSYYFPNEEEILSVVNEKFNPYIAPIEKLDLFKR
ncbi:MAG: LCP family protein [Oscillospiraceae bacterium]|nr:LCP family protein [Oscillospiraceae bacterium]